MKLQFLIPFVFAFAGLIFTSCEDSLTGTEGLQQQSSQIQEARGNGPKATGNAGLIVAGDSANFAFNALVLPNGTVKGSFTTNNDSIPIHIHGDVSCLLVDQDTAVVTGVITQINEDNPLGAAVGDFVWWKVVDNGEGENDPADLFSDYGLMTTDPACADADVNMLEIDFGNVQVFE